MSKTFPIIPEKVHESICDLIQTHCPISQGEIVEDGDEDDVDVSKIYKYVGLIDLDELSGYIPDNYKVHRYRKGVVALYEAPVENVVVFWHENVLVVMVSSDEDQHEGVMNHYGDAAVLLQYVGNAHLLGPLMALADEHK